jgi:hypothetical protein
MYRKRLAVAAAGLWAGWWTFFAFASGVTDGGGRDAAVRTGVVLAVLWLQPLLALRGTRLAGAALLLNAALLAGTIVFWLAGPWTGWLLVFLALPPALAGLLTVARGK